MFSNSTHAGKHMLGDFKDIRNTELLQNLSGLKDLCHQICAQHNFTILGELEHTFQPEGSSLVLLLSESHLSIHTFPERRFLSFDLYTCRQYENNSTYEMIFAFLKQILQASEATSTIHITDRFFD
jgi:S-adenosylmethionine decarboxylase proenzyme